MAFALLTSLLASAALSTAQLPTLFFTGMLLFIISLILLCYKCWQTHPKYGDNVGPPVLPLLGSFLSLIKNQDRMYEWATELLRQSPSLTIRNVLFGLELYTTANPANVEYMLKTNFPNYTKGFRFQTLMEDMLGRGIFNADGELWKAQRKAASYEFTSNSLKTLMLDSVQKEIANRLLPVLYGHIRRASHDNTSNVCMDYSSPALDLQDIFLRFAFDNICQVSLGVDPGCLNQSLKVDSFAKAFDDATELIIQRFFTPPLVWRLKRLLNVGSERRLNKALHVVHSFAMDVVKQRKQECIHADKDGTHPHRDLLFRLLCVATQPLGEQPDTEVSSKHLEDKQAYMNSGTDMKSDELVRDMIISFLLAGRDTSSIALSWFFWLLTQHSDVEATINEEIKRVVQASRKGRYSCLRRLNFDDDAMGSDEEQKGTVTMSPGDDEHSGRDPMNHVIMGYGICAHGIDANDVVDMNDSNRGGKMSARKELHGAHHKGNICGRPNGKPHEADADGYVHCLTDGGGQPYEAFTYEELKEMRYLQAALQEAMRLYPPVPHDTKLVVEDDVLPDGTRLCAGAQLAYHVYAMGRMESIWGKDWEKFRPERWLEQQGQPVSTFKWPVFQAGPRICLGKDMAMLQMKCVAAALIERFTMALQEGFEKPRYQLSFTLKMQHGLPVHLIPRHV